MTIMNDVKAYFLFMLLLVLPYACLDEKENNDTVSTDDTTGKISSNENISLTHPIPNSVIDSSLHIKGEARGYWFFEGDFPIELKNARGKKVVETYISASEEWMTEGFVEFEKMIFLPDSLNGSFRLVLHKANPSGLQQHSDSLIIPIRIGK